MMIQSFMSPVFSPFGHILESQSEAGTKRTQLELQPDEPVIFYRHSRPVRLDYLSGMSVLLIRTCGIRFSGARRAQRCRYRCRA